MYKGQELLAARSINREAFLEVNKLYYNIHSFLAFIFVVQAEAALNAELEKSVFWLKSLSVSSLVPSVSIVCDHKFIHGYNSCEFRYIQVKAQAR